MCVSVPGRVVAVSQPVAVVEIGGVPRRCNALLEPDLQPGDRVLVHAGMVLRVVADEEMRLIEDALTILESAAGEGLAGDG